MLRSVTSLAVLGLLVLLLSYFVFWSDWTDDPLPSGTVAQTSMATAQTQAPWANEPIGDPVQADTILQNTEIEYYDISGNTVEELETNLRIFGVERQGAEAVMTYHLLLTKGLPSDGACGFASSRVTAEIKLLMPRWIRMPNATDEACQWWSYRLRQWCETQQAHMLLARQEAEAASAEMRKADCASGDSAFAAIDRRLVAAHGNGAFSPSTPGFHYQSPGAVVETAPPVQAPVVTRPKVPGSPENYRLDLQTLDGARTSLENERGKVMVLNFWATWCGPCRREMPSLQNLYSRLAGRNIFFAFISSEKAETVKKYQASSGYNLPMYLSVNPSGPYAVGALPTTIILSKQGAVVLRQTGAQAWDREEIVNLLLQLEKE